MLLSAALIAASIVSAHATPVPNAGVVAVPSVKPFLASTTIDGETYTYDMTLPRDQRTIELKIVKNDRKGETLVTSSTVSTLVASKKFNDHPKLFGVPVEITSTSKYLIDVRDDKGNNIPVTPMTEGLFSVFYLSDNTLIVGSGTVRLKVLDATKQNEVFDKTINMDLIEGINTQKMGPYTVTVTVGPAHPTSLAVVR